jgi:hypothetical protein
MNDGVTFENAVERWLRKRGARFTEKRVRQRGRVAAHGHEVDVHAIVSNPRWKLTSQLSIVAAIVGIVVSYADDTNMVAQTALLTFAAIMFVLACVMYFGPRHVWVECKSGDATVRRDVVWKLVNQVEDVRTLQDADWYPSEAWLVARSRFDVDALSFARHHGVRCFIEQAGDIREVV